MSPLDRYYREIAPFGPSRAQVREWLVGRVEAECPDVSAEDVEEYLDAVSSADASGAFSPVEAITEVA